jgi:hypothetical protein
VSKAFGYIAVIVLTMTAGFVLIMDILKYFFGIDPVQDDSDTLQAKKLAWERRKLKNILKRAQPLKYYP